MSWLVDIFGSDTAVADLPEQPPRPHPFWHVPRREVEVTAPDQPPVRLHLRELGEGPLLLLVHGMMTSAYSFRYVIEPLGEHYRVVVPDLAGAGRSEAPEGMDMTPTGRAGVLAALIEVLDQGPAYVVGNSLGGYESLWLALEHPERVRRLLVLHAPGLPVPRNRALSVATRLPGGRALYRWLVTRDPEGFVLRNVHYHDDSIKSGEEIEEYARIFHDPDQTRMFWEILRHLLDVRHMRATARRLRDGLSVPVRFVYAREDEMVPPSLGPRYAELVPDADLEWMDDTSHFVQVDSPQDTIGRILAFDPLMEPQSSR